MGFNKPKRSCALNANGMGKGRAIMETQKLGASFRGGFNRIHNAINVCRECYLEWQVLGFPTEILRSYDNMSIYLKCRGTYFPFQ